MFGHTMFGESPFCSIQWLGISTPTGVTSTTLVHVATTLGSFVASSDDIDLPLEPLIANQLPEYLRFT